MKKKSFLKRFSEDITSKLIIILILLSLFTMVISSGVLDGQPFSALFTRGFLTGNNIRQIFYNMVIEMCFMCGLSLIIISGNIDLSTAGQSCLSCMVFAWLCENAKISWPIALLLTLILATCFGLINTFFVNVLHFPAFIATIAMSSVYGGLCNIMTNGYNIQLSQQGFLAIAKLKIANLFPVIFLFALLLIIVFQFILSKTTFGRGVFMTGGNRAATRLAGINVNRTVMILFIINSIMAAVGGLLWTCNMKLASPTGIINSGPDMTVISAVVLGGVAFTGGKGHLAGPFVALLLINVLDNTLTVLGVNSYWNVVAQGALLAIALIYDYISAERRSRALLQKV